MAKQELICKILYKDHKKGNIKEIIGKVKENQLFSRISQFICIENGQKKTIYKGDIAAIVLMKEHKHLTIDELNLAFYEDLSKSSFQVNWVKQC